MKCFVRIDRVHATKAGINTTSDHVYLDVDPAQLSEEDRALLAARLQSQDMPREAPNGALRVGRGEGYSRSDPITVLAPTVEGLLQAMRADVESMAKEKADKAAEELRQKQQQHDTTLAILTARTTHKSGCHVYVWRDEDGIQSGAYSQGGKSICQSFDHVSPDWPYHSDNSVIASPEAQAWIADLDASNATVKADAIAKATERLLAEEAKAAETKVKKEAGIAVLREWAESNGSDLLKARIEGGYEWVGLAEQDYAESVLNALDLSSDAEAGAPNGYDEDSAEAKERTTPTLEEITALREIRRKIGSLPATADLRWVKYDLNKGERSYEDDESDKEKSRTEIVVFVTVPTGSMRTYYFLPEIVPVA